MQLLLVTALAIAITSHVTRPSPAIRAAFTLQLFTPGSPCQLRRCLLMSALSTCSFSERCSSPLSHHVYAPRMVTTAGKSVLFSVHLFIFCHPVFCTHTPFAFICLLAPLRPVSHCKNAFMSPSQFCLCLVHCRLWSYQILRLAYCQSWGSHYRCDSGFYFHVYVQCSRPSMDASHVGCYSKLILLFTLQLSSHICCYI